jgi:hypothetical protein
MPQESPQVFPMPLFVGPIGVKLPNTVLNHDPCGAMSGVSHGDAFRRRLRRQDGRVGAIDDFNANPLHL